MAVTVVPYNPWKEQLAMSFLGPLVHNMIARQQQRDDNRKMNALLGEFAGGGEAPLPPGPPPTHAGTGPQGGMGEDPWERSFWQDDAQNGALAQFDAAMGMPAASADPPSDMARLMQLMASKRFGMVDPKMAMALAGPYIGERAAARQAAAQAAAQAQRQAELSQFTGGLAGLDPRAYMREMGRGAVMGYVDPKVLDHMGTWEAKALQQYKDMDLGDRIVNMSFDPVTGDLTPVFGGAKGATPGQRLEDARGWANIGLRGQELDETRRRHGALEGQWAAEFGAKRDDAMWGRNNPGVSGQFTDENGISYNVFKDGSVRPMTGADGQPLRGQPKVGANYGQVSDRDRWQAEVAGIDNEIKALERELDAINKQDGPLMTDEIGQWEAQRQAQIQPLKQRIAELRQRRAEMLKPQQTGGAGEQASAGGKWSPMSLLDGGKTSRTSGYGKRGTGHHNGIDITGERGARVKAPDWAMSTPLTVSRVVNDNQGGGLGVNVKLTGKLANGDDVEATFAHLEPGSVRVRPGQTVNAGDILAGMGNTGRTSDRAKGKVTDWYQGKDSGHHLHFEVKVNGSYVDPEKYAFPQSKRRLQPAPMPEPKIDTGGLQPAPMPEPPTPPGARPAPMPELDPEALREDPQPGLDALNGAVTGQGVGAMMRGIASGDVKVPPRRTITGQQYNELAITASRGALPGIRDKRELDAYLQQQGVMVER